MKQQFDSAILLDICEKRGQRCDSMKEKLERIKEMIQEEVVKNNGNSNGNHNGNGKNHR